jgi:putative transposase
VPIYTIVTTDAESEYCRSHYRFNESQKWERTRSRKGQLRAPDLLSRKFSIGEPNRVWTSDITFIWTQVLWTYLAVVLNLYSRMIVGWELGSRPAGSLVTIALERALELRQLSEGLILHSDRGTQ